MPQSIHKLTLTIALLALTLVACQPATDETLPTVAQLPTMTASITPSDTPAPPTETATTTSTYTPLPTDTATVTHTPTATTPATAMPTEEPTVTTIANATRISVSTATAAAIERPVFSTFTPVPAGVNVAVRPTSTGTPEVNADLFITEGQFQEEMDRITASLTNIQVVNVNIVSNGIDLLVTAPDDTGNLTTGTILVTFEVSIVGTNNVLLARPVQPEVFRMQGGNTPSDAFIETVYGDAVPALFEAFDFILNQRLGQGQHDLENVSFVDDRMAVNLVVPVSN